MRALRVESPSQDAGYDSLTFIGKGGKPADIALPVPVMRAVRVVVVGRTSGPLLLNRAGNALTCVDGRRRVNRIAKTAGCRHITPHRHRRTFCPAGLVSGVPMRDMQIAMRHAGHRVASLLAGMTGWHCGLAGAGTLRALAASAVPGAPGRRLAAVRVDPGRAAHEGAGRSDVCVLSPGAPRPA